MLVKIALAVILSLGCSLKQAQAAPRRVNVRLVVCDSAPSYWPTALNIAVKKLRKVGANIVITKREKCKDAAADRSLQAFPGASSWYFGTVGSSRPITLILAGPLADIYTAGNSRPGWCFIHNSISLVYCDDSMPDKTADVIAHEIGHHIGASHDDSNQNLMESWYDPATDFAGLSWNAAAVGQVKGCLRGWGK